MSIAARPALPVWTVEIRADGDLRAEPVDGGAVASLLDTLRDYSASVSHLPRRYSTRLVVQAQDALQAASGALEVWRDAADRAGLPDWPVAHLEVNRSSGR